jgi:hypothetical protein
MCGGPSCRNVEVLRVHRVRAMDKYRVTVHAAVNKQPVTKSCDCDAKGIARQASSLVYVMLAQPGSVPVGSVTVKVEKVRE